MALLGVELVKVVLGQLHLGAVQHGEAHAHKNILELVQGDIHGVTVAQMGGLAGNGHIQGLSGQTLVESLLLQGSLTLLQGGGEGLTDLVGHLAHHRTLLRRERSHHLEHVGELTLFSQVLDPQGIQVLGAAGLGKGGERLLADLFQLLFHIVRSFKHL